MTARVVRAAHRRGDRTTHDRSCSSARALACWVVSWTMYSSPPALPKTIQEAATRTKAARPAGRRSSKGRGGPVLGKVARNHLPGKDSGASALGDRDLDGEEQLPQESHLRARLLSSVAACLRGQTGPRGRHEHRARQQGERVHSKANHPWSVASRACSEYLSCPSSTAATAPRAACPVSRSRPPRPMRCRSSGRRARLLLPLR